VIGIILTVNQQNAFILGIIENSQVQKSQSFVHSPLVHAALLLVDFRAYMPHSMSKSVQAPLVLIADVVIFPLMYVQDYIHTT
jgi:hypothetical protein